MDDKLKILLCEDDENLGMLLREYLQAKGFVAELCADGEAGFKAFLKTKFDICVLDVMMPKKDGFTLAQEIRAASPDVPVIFPHETVYIIHIVIPFELDKYDSSAPFP